MICFPQKYEEWKDGLPDFKWLEDAMPQGERWSQFSRNLIEVGSLVKNAIEVGECPCTTTIALSISHFKWSYTLVRFALNSSF